MTDKPLPLSPEITSVLRAMLINRRRVLLAEIADIERMLGVGRYAGRDGVLAVETHASEMPVDWVRPDAKGTKP